MSLKLKIFNVINSASYTDENIVGKLKNPGFVLSTRELPSNNFTDIELNIPVLFVAPLAFRVMNCTQSSFVFVCSFSYFITYA